MVIRDSGSIRIPDIRKAVKVYWQYPSISALEISQLFECSMTTAYRLKQIVGAGRRVNTDTAYKKWGIDIDDLERRVERLNAIRKTENELKKSELPTAIDNSLREQETTKDSTH